jgi:hypothetical protein
MVPIFILSLPRAGSTLLQKILMSHPQIATTSEPWLLLPLVYSYRPEGKLSEYSHSTCQVAYEDFIKNLPQRYDDYYHAIREFVGRLYELQCKNEEKYFLDKTPRYYLISPEIKKIFPGAKYIFLFRNIVQVYASIILSWGKGRLNKLFNSYIDLVTGPKLLSSGYELLKGDAYAIQYENIIRNPKKYLMELCNYLEIDYMNNLISDFEFQDTGGRLGDRINVEEYNGINDSSLHKWKTVYDTIIKKKIITRYVESLDENILNTQGYCKSTILKEIHNVRVNNIGIVDYLDWLYSMLIVRFKLNIFISKNMSWTKKKFLD